MLDFSLKHAYNIIDVAGILFHAENYVGDTPFAFYLPLLMARVSLLLVFVAAVVLFVLTLRRAKNSVRRVLSVCILFAALFMGLLYNSGMTGIAQTGNNFYEKEVLFQIQLKIRTGSPNSWKKPLNKLVEELPQALPDVENKEELAASITELREYCETFTYDTPISQKKKANIHILDSMLKLIPVEHQQEIFSTYFSRLTKEVSAVSSTYGVGYILIVLFAVALTGTCYSERSPEGYKNNGIPANCMFAGLMGLTFALTLLYPVINASGQTTGLTKTSLLGVLLSLPEVLHIKETAAALGVNGEVMNQTWITLALVLTLASLVCMAVFMVMAAKKKQFRLRKVFSILAFVLLFAGGLLATLGLGENGIYNDRLLEYSGGIKLDAFYYFLLALSIASALVPFTVYSDKERFKVFSIVNVILFLAICAYIIVPLWKVLVDSLDIPGGLRAQNVVEGFHTVRLPADYHKRSNP